MKSRYDARDARAATERYAASGEDLALRVYTSRLLGSEPSLVLHGGGNTSVKSRAQEIDGTEREVLFVKGSGWDLASIEPRGFPACRLDALVRLCELPALSDEDMVKGLKSQMLDPSSPTPSVEALLHAFLSEKFVDHTHADAVLAVVDRPDGKQRAEDIWGAELVFVPYVMPGFVLARAIVEIGRGLSGDKVMVLDKHGIFTWGETAEESYERMISAVTRAEEHVGRVSVSVLDDPTRLERQRAVSPLLRGVLARAGQRFVIEWRDEPQILALAARPDAATVTQIGTMTPDHVIRTKPLPLFVDKTDRATLETALSKYGEWYDGYFQRGCAARKRELERLDVLPRIVLVPRLGAACLGASKGDARIAGDIYSHTAGVILDVLRTSQYQPVGELDLFDVEYWSLEQAKLSVKKAPGGPLVRKIACVTGAASGIGRATAEHFLGLGAHVLISDMNAERLAETTAALAARFGDRVAAAVADVRDEASVRAMVDATVTAFGGLDIAVSNAGTAPSGLLHTQVGEDALKESLDVNLFSHQRLAHAATDVFLAQGIGGVLLFNASKSAFNQGPEFGPYAIPKAGVIALMKQYAVDGGPHGIRANAINADRIRTDLFGGGVLEARAKARGISPDEYFQQNLLRRETTALDVAKAFGYLATADATTGTVVAVDGGNPAAFPR